MDMLFESEKQKEATERLLASVRVRTINSEIDAYLNEMLGYAKEIDSILEKNSLGARYLDRVSMIDKVDSVYLDEDLTNIDFRLKEEIEDFCMELPRYKRPKEIIFADIPRNATGKIEKPKLRKMYGADRLVEQENKG